MVIEKIVPFNELVYFMFSVALFNFLLFTGNNEIIVYKDTQNILLPFMFFTLIFD
jgi:hypothetical protein